MMPNFEASREQLWVSIRRLQRQKTLPAIRQARQLIREWMEQHPDDYYTQDAGEGVAMMEEALEILEAEKAAEPVAA
jgi:hypothetical protein